MTWPLPSSLLRDASHTTGWKDAPWQGSGPFPKMSGGEEDDEDERVLQGEMTKRQISQLEKISRHFLLNSTEPTGMPTRCSNQ